MIFIASIIVFAAILIGLPMTSSEPTDHGRIVVVQISFMIACIAFGAINIIGYGGVLLGLW